MSDETAAPTAAEPTAAGPTKQTGTEFESSDLKCCLKGQAVSEVWDICADHTCDQALHPNRPRCYAPALLKPNCQCQVEYYYDSAGYCVPLDKCTNPVKIPPEPECADSNTELDACLQPKDFPYCGFRLSPQQQCQRPHPSPLVEFIKRNRNSQYALRNVCKCKDGLCLDDCGFCIEFEKYEANKECQQIQCNGANEEVFRNECVCKKQNRLNDCNQCVNKEDYKNTKNCLCSCKDTIF